MIMVKFMNKKQIIALLVGIIFITIAFFTYNVTITFDSSHYLWLTNLLSPNDTFSNWDVARGCVFPLFIYILNVLFGVNSNALLVGMFFNYIVMLFICYLIYKEFFLGKFKKIYNILVLILFFILIAFNPIIFGYYHTLLTEFISITLAVVACYLSWKFIYINYDKDKMKFWIYTIVFAFLSIFAWNLKQPYVGTVIYPFIISIIISIFKKIGIKNFLFKILSIIISVMAIVISILVWNKILVLNNVNQNDERDSSGFFARQLIEGVSCYNREFHEDSYTKESIMNNKRISDEDKEKIYEILDKKNTDYSNFIILRSGEPEKEKYDYILYIKNEKITTGEAIKFVFNTLINRPISLLNSYISNYLAIINIYKIGFEYDVNKLFIVKEFELLSSSENTAISYKIYNTNTSNIFPLSEEFSKYAESYSGENEGLIIFNFIMRKLQNIAIILFKVILIILPLEVILVIILLIISKVKKFFNNEGIKILELIFILVLFSFLHICSHAVLGASIDRYAISAFVTNMIAIILLIHLILKIKLYKTENINNKRRKL